MANVPFELTGKSVYVAGHRGLVGSALVRRLAEAINRPRNEVVKEIGQFVGELAAAIP